MNTHPRHVAIIGAGIVGLSCALYLQRSGHRVTMYDPRGFGGGASSGNAGVVAVSECVPIGTPELLRSLPSLLFGADSPVTLRWGYLPYMLGWALRFVRECDPARVAVTAQSLAALLAHAAAAHHQLAAAVGATHLIRATGWLKAFETDRGYGAAKVDFDRMRDLGVNCEYLDRAAIAHRYPNLTDIFRHAVLHPDCLQVLDPGAYVQACGEAFLRQGGRLVSREIVSLDCVNGVVRSAASHEETYVADVFVIAAGAWSRKLSRTVGANVPLDTERGYHIVLEANPQDLAGGPVLWGEKSIVMSPTPAGLRVTSSVEFAGLQRRPDYRKLQALVPQVQRAHQIPLGNIKARWLGFRPSLPDSRPVIGPAPKADNAFLAFGHGHLGLTLGPITGALIAQLVDGRSPDIDLAPYSAQRFH